MADDARRPRGPREPDAEDEAAEDVREEQRVAGDPPLEHLASGRHDEESEELRDDDRQAPNPPA